MPPTRRERRTATVRSPVSGVVEAVRGTPTGPVVAVYIRGPFDARADDHAVHAPVDGALVGREAVAGTFRHGAGAGFVADQGKRGHLVLRFAARGDLVTTVALEVGSGYVANEVRLEPELSGRLPVPVRAGQPLGEIVVRPGNSRAFVRLPRSCAVAPGLRPGTELVGGRTVVASCTAGF